MSTKLKIGLFGFGIVGEGLYKALHQTPTLQASIEKVCIKNASKKRNAPADLFTTQKDDILYDKEINVIVEVIDDADAAFEIVSTALQNGKQVVSASKKMLAHHLPEILKLQEKYKRSFLYESAACASIPVIRNLEEYYDNDLLHSIRAIVNGSTNYMLTRMLEDKLCFADALLQAQQLGFAESNPSLDIEGFDAVNKWCLLLAHAYGVVVHPDKILFSGIQHIDTCDADFAMVNDCAIKLIAHAEKLDNGQVAAYVLPTFVKNSDALSFVRNEFNGVVIESSFADQQFFYGKGAGSFPTASAVLSDIAALRYDYKYEYKKMHQSPTQLDDSFLLSVYLRYPKNAAIDVENWDDFEVVDYSLSYAIARAKVSINELLINNWWKQKNGVSLIVLPVLIEQKGKNNFAISNEVSV